MQPTWAVTDRVFSGNEAASITGVDLPTLNNWVRYDHIPFDRINRRWIFSLRDLVTIGTLNMLVVLFEMKPQAAKTIAAAAVEDWLAGADRDVASVVAGQPESARGDYHFTAYRERSADTRRGELRAATDRDAPADTITVVLPVRSIARRIIERALATRPSTQDDGSADG